MLFALLRHVENVGVITDDDLQVYMKHTGTIKPWSEDIRLHWHDHRLASLNRTHWYNKLSKIPSNE